MATKYFYIGSAGPFMYDDTDALNDPDGNFAGGTTQDALTGDGTINIDGLDISGTLTAAVVKIQDTGGDNTLRIKPNEDLSADRVLNIIVTDGDKTVTLTGSPTLNDWFDQAVKAASSPVFATVKLSNLTDDYIPYHVDDATGLANGPTKTNVDSAVSLKHTQGTDTTLGEQTEDLEMGGYYALQLQNIPDLASKGPSYWFDGVDDVVTVANDTDLNFGTSDGSVLVSAIPLESGEDIEFWNRYQNAENVHYLRYSTAANELNFLIYEAGVLQRSIATWAPVVGSPVVLAATFVNGGTNALYINGKSETLTTDTQTGGDFAVAAAINIGKYSTYFSKVGVFRVLQFNLALSAAEVKALSSGAPVPYKYIGASQTALSSSAIANGIAPYDTFDGASATGFHVVSDGSDAEAAATQDEIGFIIGKRFRVSFDLSLASGTLPDWVVSVSRNGGNISGASTQNAVNGTNVYEFTSGETVTGAVYWLSLSTATEYTVSNFLVTQIGCVLQLEQDGIGYSQWTDKSGNDLHGAVSGAIATNLPKNPTFVGVRKIGDNTNYTAISETGDISLAGTARVERILESMVISGKGGSAPAQRVTETPYLSYTFNVGNDVHQTFEAPYNMDYTYDSWIKVHWYTHIDQTTDVVNWQAEWNAKAEGGSEVINTGSTTDTTGDVTCPVAYEIKETLIETIPGGSIAEGDIVGIAVERIAKVGGVDPTNSSIHVLSIEYEYVSNRLGKGL